VGISKRYSKRNTRNFQWEAPNYVQETLLVNRSRKSPGRSDRITDVGGSSQLSKESLEHSNPYVTSYVCILAPRFDEHELTGDLVHQLKIWFKDICNSFGWGLYFLEVQPTYIHWVMTVGIAAYPMDFIKTICQESSKRIFEDFPKFKLRNVSDEFWAPWYFVGIGEAPFSKDSIVTYINQICSENKLKPSKTSLSMTEKLANELGLVENPASKSNLDEEQKIRHSKDFNQSPISRNRMDEDAKFSNPNPSTPEKFDINSCEAYGDI